MMRPRCRRAWVRGLVLAAALCAAAAARAQNVTIRVGQSSTATVAPGATLDLPIVVDLAGASGVDVASLTVRVSYDAARLALVRTDPGSFGSVTSASPQAGVVSVALFGAQPATATFTAATLRLQAMSGASGTTTVTPAVVSAGDAQGRSLAARVVAGPALSVCIGGAGGGELWGDVNGDGRVDVLDAQQIARAAAGLSVVDAARVQRVGDVTGDGAVDVVDAQQVARFAAGLGASARVGQPTSGGCPAPGGAVRLVPASAMPYALVRAEGLPAGQSFAGRTARVGGAATPLVDDGTPGAVAFRVPLGLRPGPAEVRIPGPDGREHVATLDVAATAYVGGSVASAVADLDRTVSEVGLLADQAARLPELAAVPDLARRMAALREVTGALRASVAALSPDDRATLAALHSADAGRVAAMTRELRDAAERYAAYRAGNAGSAGARRLSARADVPWAAPAGTAALDQNDPDLLVAACEAHAERLRQLELWKEMINAAGTAGDMALLPASVAVQNAWKYLLLTANGVMAAWYTYEASQPLLLEPEGLALTVRPAVLKHGGEVATMDALVTRVSAGKVLGSGVNVIAGYGLNEFASVMQRWLAVLGRAAERLLTADFLRNTTVGVDALTSLLDAKMAPTMAQLGAAEVPVGFAGIRLLSGASPAWDFVDPAAPKTTSRRLRTATIAGDRVDVRLDARVGTRTSCMATVKPSAVDPRAGTNGFVIMGPESGATLLEFGPTLPTATLKRRQQAALDVSVRNLAKAASQALTFRFGEADGSPWRTPNGLTAIVRSAPASLPAGGSGTVSLVVQADAAASLGRAAVPLVALEGTRVVGHVTLWVTVEAEEPPPPPPPTGGNTPFVEWTFTPAPGSAPFRDWDHSVRWRGVTMAEFFPDAPDPFGVARLIPCCMGPKPNDVIALGFRGRVTGGRSMTVNAWIGPYRGVGDYQPLPRDHTGLELDVSRTVLLFAPNDPNDERAEEFLLDVGSRQSFNVTKIRTDIALGTAGPGMFPLAEVTFRLVVVPKLGSGRYIVSGTGLILLPEE